MESLFHDKLCRLFLYIFAIKIRTDHDNDYTEDGQDRKDLKVSRCTRTAIQDRTKGRT